MGPTLSRLSLATRLLAGSLGRRRSTPGPLHLLLCICDHWEPGHGNASPEQADARVDAWVTEYPRRFGHFRDSDGRPPRHTFFYPIEMYRPSELDRLSRLCQSGFGEVEVHLHHDNDTPDNLRRTLLDWKRLLRDRHGLLSQDGCGQTRYAFIHGNWALDNSRPDGRWCGVNNELDILRETGCYADFTLPSYPSQTQTRKINSIYYAVDDPHRPKSHDAGADVGFGPQPANSLMLIQGPLLLNWQSRKFGLIPRVENGNLQHNQPPTANRLDLWLQARIGVPARPDWVIVKLYTHGAPEANARIVLGEPMARFHELLARRSAEDPNFRYHYVTARETYNLVKAAEAGFTGPPADARDRQLASPRAPAPRRSTSRPRPRTESRILALTSRRLQTPTHHLKTAPASPSSFPYLAESLIKRPTIWRAGSSRNLRRLPLKIPCIAHDNRVYYPSGDRAGRGFRAFGRRKLWGRRHLGRLPSFSPCFRGFVDDTATFHRPQAASPPGRVRKGPITPRMSSAALHPDPTLAAKKPRGRAAPLDAEQPRCTLGFYLFILLNAVLFVRPAEIVPAWENLPIYEVVILACLVASLPAVIEQLAWGSLVRNPITVCVIGLLLAVFLSHASHRDFWSARYGAIMFLKIVIYYLLLVGLVNTPSRLRIFIAVLFAFILCTTILALLNHHGTIDIPALSEMQEAYGEDAETGQTYFIYRLRAMGIFNDPNDFALILNVAMFIGLHWLLQQRRRLLKLAWLLPLLPLGYALYLTQSRGGFLSLLLGLAVLLFTRVRWRRALLISAALFPAIFAVAGGRLTNIDIGNSNDTAQGRVELWRDSMVEFHGAPLFGIGQGNLADEIGHVAHNSYVHSYAELGFFGGTLFCGAFYLAVVGIHRLKLAANLSDELRSLRLCLLPVLGAYMMGLYSLSRTYGNATYVIFGLLAALLALASAEGAPVPQVNLALAKRLLLVSVGCVFYFEVFVRVLAK